MTDSAGKLFVISGPSGVGKGTLVGMLTESHPDLAVSVSSTTRKPRPGEIHGKHYNFIVKDEFIKKADRGDFLEWAEFSGNCYGTDGTFVEKNLKKNKNVLLEIDVKGALQVKNKMMQAILIFIAPPSMDELKARLFKRKTESEAEIEKRLSIVKSELEQKHKFDYIVVNKDLDVAYGELENIIYEPEK